MSQGNKPQIKLAPSPIPIENGRPSTATEAINNHINAWNKSQKNMAKDVDKAVDLLKWLLHDCHKVMNPKNKGKAEKVWVENPKFDFSQPEGEGNPFLIEEYQHAYQPDKYKENTIISISSSVLKNNEQRIRELAEYEKYLKKEAREAKKALAEGGGTPQEEDSFSTESLLDMSDWETEDATPN